jgi:uncharacterized protein
LLITLRAAPRREAAGDVRLLPAAGRPREPWANGRGRTAPVAAGDGWRLSVAQLRDSSPFSGFPGSSRLQMGLSPDGVRLSINGEVHARERFGVCAFEGEDAVFADAVGEPVEVLNLIWDRARLRGELEAVAVEGRLELTCDTGLLIAVVVGIVAGSELRGPGGVGLEHLDGLRLEPGERGGASGTGTLALARVRPAAH